MSNYLKTQISARRAKADELKREISNHEAAVLDARRRLEITLAALDAYEDAAKHSNQDDVANIEFNRKHAPSAVAMAGGHALGGLDNLSTTWRRVYIELKQAGSEFSTNDIVRELKNLNFTPSRKTIRGTLSGHIDKKIIERISDGHFRFRNSEPSNVSASEGSKVAGEVSASPIESPKASYDLLG